MCIRDRQEAQSSQQTTEVRKQRTRLATAKQRVSELEAVSYTHLKLEHMNEILANAQRARFGQSSEKRSYVLSEDQMSLFNEAEICQDSKAEDVYKRQAQ